MLTNHQLIVDWLIEMTMYYIVTNLIIPVILIIYFEHPIDFYFVSVMTIFSFRRSKQEQGTTFFIILQSNFQSLLVISSYSDNFSKTVFSTPTHYCFVFFFILRRMTDKETFKFIRDFLLWQQEGLDIEKHHCLFINFGVNMNIQYTQIRSVLMIKKNTLKIKDLLFTIYK